MDTDNSPEILRIAWREILEILKSLPIWQEGERNHYNVDFSY